MKKDKRKIYDVMSEEFHKKAEEHTGVEWDFTKLRNTKACAVKNCIYGREYGFWTCREHRNLEFEHFDPVDKYGNLFYSHRGKEVDAP